MHTWQQQAHDKERQRSVADRRSGSSLPLLLPPLLILLCRQHNGQGARGGRLSADTSLSRQLLEMRQRQESLPRSRRSLTLTVRAKQTPVGHPPGKDFSSRFLSVMVTASSRPTCSTVLHMGHLLPWSMARVKQGLQKVWPHGVETAGQGGSVWQRHN